MSFRGGSQNQISVRMANMQGVGVVDASRLVSEIGSLSELEGVVPDEDTLWEDADASYKHPHWKQLFDRVKRTIKKPHVSADLIPSIGAPGIVIVVVPYDKVLPIGGSKDSLYKKLAEMNIDILNKVDAVPLLAVVGTMPLLPSEKRELANLVGLVAIPGAIIPVLNWNASALRAGIVAHTIRRKEEYERRLSKL